MWLVSCAVIMVYGGDYALLGKVKKATRHSLGADPHLGVAIYIHVL